MNCQSSLARAHAEYARSVRACLARTNVLCTPSMRIVSSPVGGSERRVIPAPEPRIEVGSRPSHRRCDGSPGGPHPAPRHRFRRSSPRRRAWRSGVLRCRRGSRRGVSTGGAKAWVRRRGRCGHPSWSGTSACAGAGEDPARAVPCSPNCPGEQPRHAPAGKDGRATIACSPKRQSVRTSTASAKGRSRPRSERQGILGREQEDRYLVRGEQVREAPAGPWRGRRGRWPRGGASRGAPGSPSPSG